MEQHTMKKDMEQGEGKGREEKRGKRGRRGVRDIVWWLI